jgi:bacteriophage N4 adsorption protein B
MSTDIVQLAMQTLAIPVSAGILVNGLEELMIDAQYFARGLYKPEHRAITAEELAAAPPQRIAIMVAAWHEADVIESMLEHNRRHIDYDPARFDIFCGTYQNDPQTQARVDAVVRRYTNVHKVVVPHDGPTSKADCLNWIYQGIVLEENKRGQRFEILLMHDAEDIIHPLSLRLYSLEIPKYDFVQTPVFSLPLRRRDVISSTYIDEFAEHHLKDMLVREAMGGLVPSAGVGSAFERNAFEEIALANDQHPFNVDSLTEDYEVGLKFRLAGKRAHFACRSLQRARAVKRRLGRGDKTVVDEEYIATREYFPNGFAASVRQRARWITGIALQTWGQIGWKGPIPVKYSMWRDRKVVATNSFLLGAYLLVAMMGGISAVAPERLPNLIPPTSMLWWLMSFNLFLLAWRAAMKMNFVGRLYGVGHAFASVPRLIVANVIGLAATMRAIKQYLHHVWTGQPLRWAKTAHEFPTFTLLEAAHTRLGEFLVHRGRLAASDVEDALRIQHDTDLPFGEIVAGSGMMSARAVTEALAENLSIPYAEPNANDVPLALLRALPESVAAELDAMPLAYASDGCAAIAMAREPWPHETQLLEAALGGPVKVVLAEHEAIRRGRWHAYRRLVEGDRPHQRLGEALLDSDALDMAQLDDALEEQQETGERLGELLIRRGIVTAETVARALSAPRTSYRSLTGAEVEISALRMLGYGFVTLYQLVPLPSSRGVTLASPAPIHPRVVAEAARRLGTRVEVTLATALEVHIVLAIASRRAWPDGLGMCTPGIAGAEIAALLAEKRGLAAEALVTTTVGSDASPIEHLLWLGRIGADHAASLRARVLGIDLVAAHDTRDPGGLLPPELVAQHGLRFVSSDSTGAVIAAPRPTPQLAQQIADLFVRYAIAWRVLATSSKPTLAAQPQRFETFKEAV